MQFLNVKDQNAESKELGPNLEDDGNSCRSEKEKKGRLAGRKRKQNLQLFGFSGKAKDEIGHFNIISTQKKLFLWKVTKCPWEK